MKLHESITLRDGRTLGYSDIGDPSHFPVLYFHGFPGSRLEAAFAEQTILQRKVRVLAVERPGYGQSTHYPERKITDWPGDIEQLVDALGLPRFSLLGVSAGGIYALACAHALSERVHCTGIAGTLAPMYQTDTRKLMAWLPRNAYGMLNRQPRLARLFIGRLNGALSRHRPDWVINGILPGLCKRDRHALGEENFRREFTKSIKEAYRHGYAGPLHDLTLTAQDWGFRPQDIRVPVHLWHGLADTIVPPVMGHYLKDRLPNCHSIFPEDEGHFSIVTNYMGEALRTLSHGSDRHTTLAEALQPIDEELELEI